MGLQSQVAPSTVITVVEYTKDGITNLTYFRSYMGSKGKKMYLKKSPKTDYFSLILEITPISPIYRITFIIVACIMECYKDKRIIHRVAE